MFFIGCARATSVQPTIIPTLLPSSTSSFTSVSSQTAEVVPTATPSLYFYYPKVEKLCPEKREVSIDRLDIPNNLKIILTNPDQTGLWSLISENPSPQLVQELPLDKWTSKAISPDGKLLAYTIWNADHSSSTWVYDLESNNQREVLNVIEYEGLSPNVNWVSQNQLLVVNGCAGAGCRFPIKVINIETGESLDVKGLDREPYNYDEYQAFYVDNKKYYALYSEGNPGNDYVNFYAYDYVTRHKIQVFPWLQDKVFFYPYGGTNLGLEFATNKIFMMIEQSYGYDFGVTETSIDMLTQNTYYDVLMKRFVTGDYFDELDFSFVRLDSANNVLILSMNYKDYVNGETNPDFSITPKIVEKGFFVLDLEHPVIDPQINYLVFTDYCFATTGYYVNKISPDGKIVVLNSDDDIMLLNLETGYITHLPNWKFIGWGK